MKRLALVVALVAVSFAAKAEAVVFTGTASGSWTNVDSQPGDVTSVANNDIGGTANFNWGTPVNTPFDNQFTFDGIGSDGDPAWSVNSEDPFLIGNFTYRNGSTSNSTTVNGVDLLVNVTLSSPLALNNNYTFGFDITNTPNNTGDPVLDGDIVTVANMFSPTVFNFDGVDYTLQLLGFSSDGGATIRTDFSSPEAANAEAGVYAKITSRIPNTVPEPTTMLLMASGLGGLIARRRKV